MNHPASAATTLIRSLFLWNPAAPSTPDPGSPRAAMAGKRFCAKQVVVPITAFMLLFAVSCGGKKETTAPKERINPEVLFKAIENSDAAKIKETLLKDPELAKAKDSAGLTALYYAAGNGWQDICEILLNDGADINAGDSSDDSPLHFASMNGWTEAAEALLKHKANVNKQDNEGYHTPGIAAAPNSGAQNVTTMKPASARPARGVESDSLMLSGPIVPGRDILPPGITSG